jgi:hypothetical protein
MSDRVTLTSHTFPSHFLGEEYRLTVWDRGGQPVAFLHTYDEGDPSIGPDDNDFFGGMALNLDQAMRLGLLLTLICDQRGVTYPDPLDLFREAP